MPIYTDSPDKLVFADDLGHSEIIERNKICMAVAHAQAKYTMDHGRFRFSEVSWPLYYLRPTSFDEGADGVWSAPLCDENGNCFMTGFLDADGSSLNARFELSPGHKDINRMRIRFPAWQDEHVYGGGEIFSEFDLRGKVVRVWVAEHTNAGAISKKIIREKLLGKKPEHKEKFSSYETYYAQPTFVSSRRYFFHSDATSYCEFDFTHESYHEMLIREIAPMHICFAADFAGLSMAMSSMLGHQPELPEWVYDGAILGVQGGSDTVRAKVDAALAAHTKVAGVWCQDWEGRRITAFGKQLMWNWEYDRELYPDLPVLIRELNEKGIKFLGYVNPFLAVEKDLYKYASAHGYCVKDKNGADYLVTITTFPAAMVDLTNPEAVGWLKDIIKTNMIGIGISGWMADFGEYLPTDCVLHSREDPQLVHCTWPALWSKLNREAVEEAGRLGEVFFFTRAGHTGSVGSSLMMWNGDQHTDWSVDCGLPSVIPATLSLAVCGFGLCHSDVGGYITFPPMHRTPELFMRWAEMSAFSPLMRSHEGNRPDDNAQFDADGEVLMHHARMSAVHAALKPYLMDAVKQNAENGLPVMRPLFWSYDDEASYLEKTEYLLGGDLLVAPILVEGAKSRSVYLPGDEWLGLWDGREYSGGTFNVDAPFGRPPVFMRKNSAFRELFESLKEVN